MTSMQAYHLGVDTGIPFKDDIRVRELGNEMENYAILMPCEDSGWRTTIQLLLGPCRRHRDVRLFQSALGEGKRSAARPVGCNHRSGSDHKKSNGNGRLGLPRSVHPHAAGRHQMDISVWHLYESHRGSISVPGHSRSSNLADRIQLRWRQPRKGERQQADGSLRR